MKARRKYKERDSRARDQKGSMTIEFVVTLPLMVGALAFAFEFGQLFLAHHTTVNNARAAMRYLARSDLSATNLSAAEEIVRSGVIGGTAPAWATSTHMTVSFDTDYHAISSSIFRQEGKSIRVVVSANYPTAIFNLMNIYNQPNVPAIPFTVAEDIKYVGQ